MAENFERAPSSTYTHSAPGGDSRNEEAAPRRHNNTKITPPPSLQKLSGWVMSWVMSTHQVPLLVLSVGHNFFPLMG